MAIRKKHLEQIGGYDEDLIGIAADDNDLMSRLQAIGCTLTYAQDTKIYHMYHKRTDPKKLLESPHYLFNCKKWKEKKDPVRNKNKNWGYLCKQDPNDDNSISFSLALWVTSLCTLNCPHCNQKTVRQNLPDYEMSRYELTNFIASCKERGIHFLEIELTGGEPSLWSLLEESIPLLKEIANEVSLITNGNNAEEIVELLNKHSVKYAVSVPQATPEQIAIHSSRGIGVTWNNHIHKPLPICPVENSLPPICSGKVDREGRLVKQLFYLNGKVYYCCTAKAGMNILGYDECYVCNFESNFIEKFSTRKDDLPICTVCLCNAKVWESI
jgi:hypothetical protein